MSIQVAAISFTDGGAMIQFMEMPGDVRVKGAVVLQRQVILDGRHPDYREDLERLHAVAARTVKNALEDWQESEPWSPDEDDEDDDEDDDRGMGD